jgi:excisionase family DNA binding protein
MHRYMNGNKLNIGDAAKYLNLSIDTLRRWDKNDKLPAKRSEGGHRYYHKLDLDLHKEDIFALATNWVLGSPKEPKKEFYCPTSMIFKGRLSKLQSALEKTLDSDQVALLVAISGEIGNNAFDHNIGNWPDTVGMYFAYNTNKGQIAIADKGRGVLKTLRRVKTSIRNDSEALQVAFTERISGRAPEKRGNGLKLVRNVVSSNPMDLNFYSGNAQVTIANRMTIKKNDLYYNGCIALISYDKENVNDAN